jgi:hypothetical protein
MDFFEIFRGSHPMKKYVIVSYRLGPLGQTFSRELRMAAVLGFEQRLSEWQCEFVIPQFVLHETEEQQPHLPWFDKGVSQLHAANGITPKQRQAVIARLTQLYKKITPSNTLLAHQLAEEEEADLFKANKEGIVYYDNACLHRCKDLATHIAIIQDLAADGVA